MSITPTTAGKGEWSDRGQRGHDAARGGPGSQRGRRVARVLSGGILLNRNYEVVDRIRATIFKEQVYKGVKSHRHDISG